MISVYLQQALDIQKQDLLALEEKRKKTRLNCRRWHNKNKEREKIRYKKYSLTFNGIIHKLYKNVYNNNAKRNISLLITKQDIIDLFLASNNKCAKTGIEFDYSKPRGPFIPSLDRIDSSKGYSKDNIQIVCWIYNTAKANNTHEEVIKFAKALLNHEINKEINS